MTTQLTRRHVLGLGLAGITVGLLAGCSSDDSSTDKNAFSGKKKGAMSSLSVNEQFKATAPLTISMLFQDNPAYPEKSSWALWDDITKKTNVTLKPTIVPFADYDEKRSLLINSGNAPTIIAKTYPGSETQFVGGGAIIAASDYTKYMPNFTDKVKKWNLEPDLAGVRQADGKFYVFPGLHQTIFVDYTLAARTDVLKDDGLDVPTTYSEFRSVLKQLKKKHPDVQYPLSERFDGNNILGLACTAYGTSGLGWTSSLLYYDTDSKKFTFGPTSDQCKEVMQYFAGLIKDGLMDPESFTQSDDQAQAKFTTGKSFFISTNAQTLELYKVAMDQNLGAGKYKAEKIPNLVGPLGKVVGGSRLENGIMISSSATKEPWFEALLQFVDWLWYSDPAQAFVKWGIEGKTYKVEDGKYELLPGYKLTAYGLGDPNAKTDIRTDMGFECGNFAYAGTTKIVDSTMSDDELAWQKVMAAYKQLPPAPSVPYTPTQLQQATLQQTALQDAVNTASLDFMLGKQGFDQWDSYVSSLEQKGLQQYVDNANKYYEQAQSKTK